MRCPECDYPLWNLKTRECPECGRAFRPSDFEFVVNSVRFCCPHCDQTYYGTGEHGHLVPAAFDCVRCGRPVTLDDMVLRPAEGVLEEQTRVEQLPWLERSRVGFVKGWLVTVLRGMIAPHRVARGLPDEPRPRQAWWFLFVTWIVFALGGIGLPLLAVALAMSVAGDPGALPMLLVAGAGAIGGSAVVLALAFLWVLATHVILRLTGGASGPLGRSAEAICYSGGAAAIVAVPCVGPYCGSSVGFVWWLVSAILVVTMSQKVHGGRASLAVLTLPLLALGLTISGYFGFLFYFLPNANTLMTRDMNTVQAQVQVVTDALLASDQPDGAAWPAHGVRLLEADLTAADFLLAGSATMLDQVAWGEMTLLELDTLPPQRRREAIGEIVDAMPDDLVAHRVGDFVFTYHGIDPRDADPGLWVVTSSPEGNTAASIGAPLLGIGLLDGSVRSVLTDGLADELAMQNELRAEHGLPPIPDPATVTHDAPARMNDAP